MLILYSKFLFNFKCIIEEINNGFYIILFKIDNKIVILKCSLYQNMKYLNNLIQIKISIFNFFDS